MFNISVLLDVQANLPETNPFFVCPNGFGEHLFSNVYIDVAHYMASTSAIEDLIICILLSFSILSCRPKVIGDLNIIKRLSMGRSLSYKETSSVNVTLYRRSGV